MQKQTLLPVLVFVVMVFFFSPVFSQGTGSIKGIVQDSAANPLAGATVTMLNLKDSTVHSGFALTTRKGEFEMKGINFGSYEVSVSYQGFKTYLKKIELSPSKTAADLGNIHLENSADVLSEVIVTDNVPIRIKGDTIQYKADLFKTAPNATVEDLFKKLPGVQVDKDGNIQAQGEDVQRVLVDGKEFFGNDPKLATKNLTAEMVESIQLFDDMSDQAKFTRMDDGERRKTINIKLKADRKKGYFGRASAGYGSDDRYEASLSLNKFNGDQQLSLVAGSNNVNKQTFSFNDVVGSMGGFGSNNSSFRSGGGGFGGASVVSMGGGGAMRSGGGGQRGGGGGAMRLGTTTSIRGGFGGGGGFGSGGTNGITRASNAGLNFRDKWGTKLDVNGSYFFSDSKTNQNQESFTQNFFTDSSSNQHSSSISSNINQNHRFDFRMEYNIDSNNTLLITPRLVLQHSETSSYDTSAVLASKGISQYLRLTGTNDNSSVRDGVSFSNELLLRHRFSRTGRTFTFGWQTAINDSKGSGQSLAPYVYYLPDGTIDNATRQDLSTAQKTSSNNNTLTGSYTEPIGSNKLVELNYAYTNNQSKSDKKAFDYDAASGKFEEPNLPQTNNFDNKFTGHRLGTNFRVKQSKYDYQLGGGVQWSEMNNKTYQALTAKDSTIKQSYLNFFPTANFNYNFTRSQFMRVEYRGRTNQPSINQLQNVPDVTNPLQVINGNPGLKQEFTHDLSLNYNTFNVTNFQFLSVRLAFSTTANKIANSIDSLPGNIDLGVDIDRSSSQYIVPVNVKGIYNTSSFVTLGFPLRGKLQGSNINFNNSIRYGRDVSQLYKAENVSKSFTVTQTAGINLNIASKLDLGLNGSLSYNSVSYSQNKSAGTISTISQDQRYYSQTYTADVTYTMPYSFLLATTFNYYINTGRSAGFNQNVPLWNASLARQLFKKKNGELKFSVNDILNQNQSINRSITTYSITDTRNMVLKRYFLVSFMYNLNKFGNQQQSKSNFPKGMQVPRQIENRMRQNSEGGTPPPPSMPE